MNKKIYSMVFAFIAMMFCGINAMAETTIKFDHLTIEAGQTSTVNLLLNNDTEVQSLEYTFSLPEGLTATKIVRNNDRLNRDEHEATLDFQEITAEGRAVYKISVFSKNGENIIGNEGTICTVTIVADEEFSGEQLKIKCISAILSDSNGRNVTNNHPYLLINDIVATVTAAPEKISFTANDQQETITVAVESNMDVYGLNATITLPEGLSFVKDANGSKIDFTYLDRMGDNLSITQYLKNDGSVNIVINGDDPLAGLEGDVFSFQVTASDVTTLADNSKIEIKDIWVTNFAANTNNCENVVVEVKNGSANENAWTAIKAQIANVEAAIANYDAEVAKMNYASRVEGEEFNETVDAAREWVTTTKETYQAKYEAGELTAEDGVKGESAEKVLAVNEALNSAAKYDINRYVQAVVYYWMGDEEDIVGKKEYVEGVIETLAGAGKSALEEQVVLLETAIQGLLNDWEAYSLYTEEAHKTLIEKAEAIKANITDIVAQAEEAEKALANDNAWTAIQAQIANVEAAIANYDAEVAKMNYASRVEGEEFNETVDAAREWVTTTKETYQAKYEAGELTAEDGVKGESAEKVLAVNEALNSAAKYDINRYVQAVVYYWMGDEEDIVGKKEYVEGVIETLAGAGKSALEEQVVLLETAIQGLLDEWEAYSLYTEEAHNALIEKAEAIKANITDIVAQAEEAEKALANDNAWTAIQAQIANVEAAIANYDAEVAKMNYASRVEGEEFNETVDAAREWVTTTTETYQAKYEAGELTAEDGVKGESAEQVQAVYEALNMAAYYDVYRYVQAVYYNWYGNEEDIVGKRDFVESIMEKMSTAGQSAFEEQVALLDIAISNFVDEMFAYTQYSAETHQAYIDKAADIQANIADIVAQAEEARQSINWDAAENDYATWEKLVEEATNAITQDLYEYVTPEENEYLQWLMGEDIPTAIMAALEAVETEGWYETPEILNVDEVMATIEQIRAAAEERKEIGTGINGINNAENAEYYNLNGVKTSKNVKGLAIKKVGNKTVKVIVK